MTFIDRPLPETLVLPRIAEKPRDRRLDNLRPRLKGGANKITRDVKEGILEGAIAFGSDGTGAGGLTGYFTMCAAKYPKAYMHLLGKLVPMNLTSDGTVGNHIASVNIISVPTNTFLSPDDMAKVRDRKPLQIEHMPAPVEGSCSEEELQIARLKQQIAELAQRAGIDVEL